MLTRIQIWDWVGQVALRWWNALTAKVWEIDNLVFKHQVYRLFSKNFRTSDRRTAIVQQGSEDFCKTSASSLEKSSLSIHTAIFLRLGEASSSSTVNTSINVGLIMHHQWTMQEVVSWLQLSFNSTRIHVSQTCLHPFIWKHRDVFETQRRENMFLEVGVERLTQSTFDAYSCPIDTDLLNISVHLSSQFRQWKVAYAILPPFSWLVDQRLNQVFQMARKFIVANRFRMVAKAFVKESVTEAS